MDVWCFAIVASLVSLADSTGNLKLSVATQREVYVFEEKISVEKSSVEKFSHPVVGLVADNDGNVVAIEKSNSSHLVVNTLSESKNVTKQYSLESSFDIKMAKFEWRSGEIFAVANATKVVRIREKVPEIFGEFPEPVRNFWIDSCRMQALAVSFGGSFMRLDLGEISSSGVVAGISPSCCYVTTSGYGFSVHVGKSEVCHSSGGLEYYIRSWDVDVAVGAVFLADSHNMVVWKVKMSPPGDKICRPEAWVRLAPNQPGHVAVLNPARSCARGPVKLPENDPLTPENFRQQSNFSGCGGGTFCINGNCTESSLGAPVCLCADRYSGFRCEIDKCRNFCLDGGICTTSSGRPVCQCRDGFGGDRCQIRHVEKCRDYFPAFVWTAGFAGLALIGLLFSTISYLRLKKSGDTLRKLKAATSNTHCNAAMEDDDGKSCRAFIGAVVDLEDCCQMTICEKPCVEANFRKAKSRNLNNKKFPHSDAAVF